MIGAEKAHLFKTGQYGRLYITSSSHARGRTLRIQVLPDGEKAIPHGSNNPCLNNDAVMVYDAISGKLGWTETYGWLHKGKWQDDFEKLVVNREKEIKYYERKSDERKKEESEKEQQRISELLSGY